MHFTLTAYLNSDSIHAFDSSSWLPYHTTQIHARASVISHRANHSQICIQICERELNEDERDHTGSLLQLFGDFPLQWSLNLDLNGFGFEHPLRWGLHPEIQPHSTSFSSWSAPPPLTLPFIHAQHLTSPHPIPNDPHCTWLRVSRQWGHQCLPLAWLDLHQEQGLDSVGN